MKKRIVLAMVFLVSLSMLLSSFAHAAEAAAETQCSSGNTQLLDQVQMEISNLQGLLIDSKDADERALLENQIAYSQKIVADMNAQLDNNCP